MTVTDSIGDMLSRIRNAATARMETVDIPHSRMKEEIAKVLKEEGFIGRIETPTKTGKKVIRITLKYRPNKERAITELRRVSKPGRRVYVGLRSIPKVLSGFGTAILSTQQGIMTDSDARAKKVGGEVLCYVW
jgi:small subunit ribosomal protein S8